MRNTIKGVSAAIALGLAALAGPSSAAILNLSASGAAVDFTFAAGKYRIDWIGVADGGDYDSAFINFCQSVSCLSGWSNAFTARELPINAQDFDVDFFTTGGFHASALESLAAYQAGPVHHLTRRFINGVPQSIIDEGDLPNPWIVNPDQNLTVRLAVLDPDGNFTGNTGGVSLRITEVAAVPEPASWALLIGGFAMAGASLRRRKTAVAR